MEILYSRKVQISYDVDIVVVGAGMAGIAAALAAAHMGQKVLLIERFGVLGGNATSGGVGNFSGNTVGMGRVLDTVIAALEEFNAIAPRMPGKDGRVFNHEILAVILPELMVRAGVEFLLHTEFVDVTVKDGRICEALICGPSGLEAVRASQFIDCTGEGCLAVRAGFSTMKGGENGYQLPMSLMYFVRHVPADQQVCEVPGGWFESIRSKDDLPMTSFWPNGNGSNAIKIKIPMYDSTNTQSLTKAEVNGRRKMMAVLDYHQRVEKHNFILDHCSAIIGIREGCRIVGDYILTVDDVRSGRSFDDAVAVGSYYLDGHKTDDDKRTYILPKESLAVPPYDIPLRALIAKNGENLMMAGRCLSADQLALSSARVMPTCSMMGEAVGITAALAVERKKSVRDIPASEVQERMIRGGAVLDKSKVPHFTNLP